MNKLLTTTIALAFATTAGVAAAQGASDAKKSESTTTTTTTAPATKSDAAKSDMFIANDPYNGGGTHLPDINVIAPVFIGKRIVAYVANIAHHADVGGMVPGSEAAVCQSIYQEGIRIPPVRIMRRGVVNRDVFDLVLLNSRTPDERVGDLHAQFAANTVGARGVTALFDRYGERETRATIAAYLDFTERRFRAAIDRLPLGRYMPAPP